MYPLFFSKSHRAEKVHKRTRRFAFRPGLERLEDRVVPSCDPGISAGVLQTNCSFGPDVIELDHAGSTTTITVTGLAPRSFADGLFGQILLQTGSTDGQTVYVRGAPVARPLTVYGGGSINSIVYLYDGNGSVQGILSPVGISEPPQGGRFTISLLDYNDPTLRHVTFTATSISGLTPMPVTFDESIPTDLYVQTGVGGTDVNVLSTPNFFHDETQTTTVQGNSSNDTVHVGNNGSVQNIHGKLYVENNPSRTTNLIVDDSSDSGNRTVTMQTDPGQFPYGQITGLAPGTIDYEYAHVTAVDLHTGTATEVVNVAATGPRGLNLIGHSASTTVNVGSAGSVQDIQGELTVSNPAFLTDLYVHDDSDSGNRTVAVGDDPADSTFGQIIGLAPGPIYFRYIDVTAVDVHTGTGTEVVNVTAAGPRGLNLFGHSAHTIFNLGNAGSVQSIRGEITVTNPGGFLSDLTVDDRNDAVSQAPVLSTDPGDTSFGQITGLAPGPIYYRYADTSSLALYTGTTTAMVNVLATGAPVDLAGNDSQGTTINLGNAGSVQQIASAMSLSSLAGPLNVNFNDQNDTVDRNVMLDDFNSGREFMRLVGLAPTTIFSTPDGGGNYIVNGGSGSNLFSVLSTSVLVTTTINGGAGGNDTLVGPDGSTNLWQLIDGNQDQLFANGNQVAIFGGFSNLVGGSGNNTFQFSDGYQLAGSIDGGGGVNTLNYFAYSTDVYVNLQLIPGVATGVGGGVTRIQNVSGGQGNNILVGNGGNVLSVFAGHNLVIAGGSGSTLNGGNGLNILIGGTTDYDTDFTSLRAILDFWNTVTPDNYDDSVNTLLAGTGVPALNTATVHSNGGGNHFSGGSLDLYFGSLTLDTYDPPNNGRVIEI